MVERLHQAATNASTPRDANCADWLIALTGNMLSQRDSRDQRSQRPVVFRYRFALRFATRLPYGWVIVPLERLESVRVHRQQIDETHA